MKPLVCEMCGSHDLIKKGGVFECQYCGTKYSVEEARKMMFDGNSEESNHVVRIDNTDKLEKLYQIARRAKTDGNTASAAKYYDMILQEDPMSWEASFYTTYYASLQTNIAGIQSAANTISNSLHSVLELIAASTMDLADKKKAIHEINGKVKSAAAMFYRTSMKHYVEISDNIRSHYTREAFARVNSAVAMLFNLGDLIDDLFSLQPNLGSEATIAWEAGLKLLGEIMKLNYELPKLKEIEKLYIDKITHHSDDENYDIRQEKILHQIKELNEIIEKTPKTYRSNIGAYIFSIVVSLFGSLYLAEEGGFAIFFIVMTLLSVLGLLYQISQKEKNIQKVEDATKKRDELQAKLVAIYKKRNS